MLHLESITDNIKTFKSVILNIILQDGTITNHNIMSNFTLNIIGVFFDNRWFYLQTFYGSKTCIIKLFPFLSCGYTAIIRLFKK